MRRMNRFLLAALLCLTGCAGERSFFIEARGDSVRIPGASAGEADALRLAANRALASVDVPALARACGAALVAGDDWEIRRGSGEFAGGDPLGTGRTISIETKNETLNAEAPQVPSLSGRRMRGVVKLEIRAWPHKEGAMSEPGLLCPQAEVDLVAEPGLEEEARAFARRLADRALTTAVEALASARSGK
jgi:hypothetical protein